VTCRIFVHGSGMFNNADCRSVLGAIPPFRFDPDDPTTSTSRQLDGGLLNTTRSREKGDASLHPVSA
jgi:hypothetical protein